MNEAYSNVTQWLATYALASSVLGAITLWLAPRVRVPLRDVLVKCALVLPLVPATLTTLPNRRAATEATAESIASVPSAKDVVRDNVFTLRREFTLPAIEIAPRGAAAQFDVRLLILLTWLGGVTILFIHRTARTRRMWRLLGKRHPITDARLLQALRDVSAAGDGRIRLTQSATCPCPLAIGTREICLPADVANALDTTDCRAILAHELAHLHRRDPLWRLGTDILQRVFWFQPLTILLQRELSAVAEMMADAEAATTTGSHLGMAGSLVRAGEWLTGHRAIGLSSLTGGALRSRIEILLNPVATQATSRLLLRGSVAIALGLAAALPSVTIAAAPRAANVTSEREAPIVQATLSQPPGQLAMSLEEEATTVKRRAAPSSATRADVVVTDAADADVTDADVVTALIALLHDQDAHVRAAALSSLRRFNTSEAVNATRQADADGVARKDQP